MSSKTQSIVSYLGIFWLVSYFAGKDERDDVSRYHLKQGLGLLIIAALYNILLRIILRVAPAAANILGLAGILFLILMIFGIINAVNVVKKPLPIIGKMFESKFSFIDK